MSTGVFRELPMEFTVEAQKLLGGESRGERGVIERRGDNFTLILIQDNEVK